MMSRNSKVAPAKLNGKNGHNGHDASNKLTEGRQPIQVALDAIDEQIKQKRETRGKLAFLRETTETALQQLRLRTT